MKIVANHEFMTRKRIRCDHGVLYLDYHSIQLYKNSLHSRIKMEPGSERKMATTGKKASFALETSNFIHKEMAESEWASREQKHDGRVFFFSKFLF